MVQFDPFMSAAALAAALRARDISAPEVMTAYLDRITRLNPSINAFVWMDEQLAMDAARDSQARLDSGVGVRPFEGVPLPMKDFGKVRGNPDTMGSNAFGDERSTEDGLVASLFRGAGFALMGRTNTPELAALTDTANMRYGITRNPWNLERSVAGSSGGAAAAVAAGLAPAAHASDGGGSIRMPASANGLVGLKPSRGRVPAEAEMWNYATTEGVITRTVNDTAAILDVLAPGDALGWWPTQPPSRPFANLINESPGSLRIGILPLADIGIPVDEDCAEAVAITARALESMGHRVIEVSPFLFEPETLGMFVEYVMATYSALLAGDNAAACEPFIQYKIAQARSFSSAEYVALLRSVQRQSREVVAQWGRDFDVLLTPSMATTLPRAGQVFDEANANPAGERMLERRMAGFTLTASLSGLPAASFPVHADRDGLPLGIQLIGRPGDDATILQLGQALEKEFDWASRRPRMDF
jgi:amidase